MFIVIEEKAYRSGFLAGVTAMTLMTVIYGLILDKEVLLYFVGPYHLNLTRRTRRAEHGVPYLCGL